MRLELDKIITMKDNEAFLRQISTPVQCDDKELNKDLKVLEDFCMKNDVLAMASVQLGIPKRLIYVKNTKLDIIRQMQVDFKDEEYQDYNEARVFINPIIVEKQGLTEYWEACASCGDKMGHVYRPYKIIVEYFDRNWKKKREIFEGFESTVISHEYDHLDGILHIDIADQILVMSALDRGIWRQTHDYNIISKEGDYETLLKTKTSVFVKKR